MSKGICIFASQIATFIAKNQHLNFLYVFLNILIHNFPELKKFLNNDEIKYIKSNSNNIKRYNKIQIQNIQKKKRFSVYKDLRIIISKIDSLDDLKKEQERYLKKLERKLEKDDYSVFEILVPSILNKLYGIKNEKYVIDYYNRSHDEKIISPINLRVKHIYTYLDNELYLIGKIDGIRLDGTVVEIKNRIFKFFSEIREYEWIQIQCYLELYNLENAELIEYLKNENHEEIKIKKILREKNLWKDLILSDIIYYFKALVEIGNNEEIAKDFFALNNSEKIEYIKKIIRDNRR